ncbi:hypothetical protein, partial [Nocardia pseudovaccinii]|uniref:hypothetical protein n=1 Tax=Nocardia pseudovaccinii TaxID=189540 RepID=UPI000B208D33
IGNSRPGSIAPASDDFLTALRDVVEYNRAAEVCDYRNHADGGGHIIHALSVLAHSLDQRTSRPRYRPPWRLQASLADDVDPDIVDQVLAELSELTDPFLACVRERHTGTAGFHGNRRIYIQSRYQLYELGGNLWAWLTGTIVSTGPGLPATWLGTPILEMDLDLFGAGQNFAQKSPSTSADDTSPDSVDLDRQLMAGPKQTAEGPR